MSFSKRFGRAVKISAALNQRRDLFSRQKLTVHELMLSWKDVVGEGIAAHSSPEEFRSGDLWVVVDDPIWISELSLLKDEIASEVKTYLGRKSYLLKGGVKFRNGKVYRPESAPAPLNWAPDPEAEKEIDEAVSSVGDEKLREALKHYLMIPHYKRID